jgi:nucleotide-binding universal stress UspA family protein
MLWLAEGTWEGCIDTAAPLIPEDARVSLLYVVPEDVLHAAGAAAEGLIGRWRPRLGPTEQMAGEATASGEALVAAAAGLLGRAGVGQVIRRGRVEREVVRAAEAADLLVVARDGDRSRLGPHSLGPATRFVVDHAPCSVLLVWPDEVPDADSIPPPPEGRRRDRSASPHEPYPPHASLGEPPPLEKSGNDPR